MSTADPSVLVAGETLIDFLPESTGPIASVETFHRRPGGAPANVAVGLARLDRPPLFWTRIGEDPFGRFLETTLADAGIPDRFITRDPDAKTALAFVSLGEDADREFSFYRHETADTRLSPDRARSIDLDPIEWIHLGGVTLTDEPARSATYALAERAAEAGCTVSFDPNARPELWTEFDFAASVGRMLEHVDLLKVAPEDVEAAGYGSAAAVESTPEPIAKELADAGPNTVCLTLGSEGAFGYATPEAHWAGDEPVRVRHSGYRIEPEDTTGAGDAFTAGLIDGLSEGSAFREAIARANAVAAVTTTAAGAMTALPTRSELESFLADVSEAQ